MKRDLFSECFDGRVSPEEFKKTFCDHCRNPTCSVANWNEDMFGSRVSTQMDKLFNPVLADPNNPKYSSLRERDFPSLFREAIRLETADRIGDWSIPSENVVLANIAPEAASNESQDLVEKALKSLKQGRDQGDQDTEEVEIETLPSTEQDQEIGDQEVSEPESAPEKPKQNSHQNVNENKQVSENKLQNPSKPEHTLPPKGSSNFGKNTDFQDGFTIGGDLPSQEIDTPRSTRKRVLDSWGSSDSKIIEPGTKVNMGKKKK